MRLPPKQDIKEFCEIEVTFRKFTARKFTISQQSFHYKYNDDDVNKFSISHKSTYIVPNLPSNHNHTVNTTNAKNVRPKGNLYPNGKPLPSHPHFPTNNPQNEQPQRTPYAGPFVDPFADPITPYDPPSYSQGIQPREKKALSSTAYNPYAPTTSSPAAASPFEPLRHTQVTSTPPRSPERTETGRQRADSIASDFLDLPPPVTVTKKKTKRILGLSLGWWYWIIGMPVALGLSYGLVKVIIYFTDKSDPEAN